MAKKYANSNLETPATPAKTTTAPKVVKKVAAKKAAAKSTPAPAPAPAPTPAPAPAPVEAAPVENTVVEEDYVQDFSVFSKKLQEAISALSGLKSEFKTLEKKYTKELKLARKASAKKRRSAGNRAPSGFVRPTLVTDELASFLGKPTGTEMARTEVTKEINKYIRANNLQDKENGRKINPDAALSKLLKLKKDDELTYFNLQRYMSPHFAKATSS